MLNQAAKCTFNPRVMYAVNPKKASFDMLDFIETVEHYLNDQEELNKFEIDRLEIELVQYKKLYEYYLNSILENRRSL